MRIWLHESIINEDERRSKGRVIAEIRCKGDGTKGKIFYLESCNDLWTIKAKTHPLYDKKRIIFDDYQKERLEMMLNEPIYVTTGGGSNKDGTEHSTSGEYLEPWHEETLEYIIEYSIPASVCGSICARIKEDVFAITEKTMKELSDKIDTSKLKPFSNDLWAFSKSSLIEKLYSLGYEEKQIDLILNHVEWQI